MTGSSPQNSLDNSKNVLAGLAPLEAVLFDVDGTLCDSDPFHYQAFYVMLQEIGFNGGVPITEDYYIENIAGKHNDDVARLLFPDDFERGVKFTDDKEAMFRRLAAEKLKPLDGLEKVKKWVEDRGLKRAAVTNAPRPNAELMLTSLGLSDFFDVVIIGNECDHAKPHPEPYLKALEILKASKDHTFIFEDSASGIKAGVAAGMPVVGITIRNPEHLLMEAKPTLLIKDYTDPKLWEVLEELDTKGGILRLLQQCFCPSNKHFLCHQKDNKWGKKAHMSLRKRKKMRALISYMMILTFVTRAARDTTSSH